MKFLFINTDLYILDYRQDDIFILMEVSIVDFLLRSQNQDRLKWLKEQLMKEIKQKAS